MAIFIQSLAQRVPLNWMVREFKERVKLDYEVEAFSLYEDHQPFRFKSKEDSETILRGGPWFVAS